LRRVSRAAQCHNEQKALVKTLGSSACSKEHHPAHSPDKIYPPNEENWPQPICNECRTKAFGRLKSAQTCLKTLADYAYMQSDTLVKGQRIDQNFESFVSSIWASDKLQVQALKKSSAKGDIVTAFTCPSNWEI
jgi:hypothetical protein